MNFTGGVYVDKVSQPMKMANKSKPVVFRYFAVR